MDKKSLKHKNEKNDWKSDSMTTGQTPSDDGDHGIWAEATEEPQ